jgi:hypothetical protein
MGFLMTLSVSVNMSHEEGGGIRGTESLHVTWIRILLYQCHGVSVSLGFAFC